MQTCIDGIGDAGPKRFAYLWSSDVPAPISDPWVCYGCACVRNTALDRK
jgi:hypothetical protein